MPCNQSNVRDISSHFNKYRETPQRGQSLYFARNAEEGLELFKRWESCSPHPHLRCSAVVTLPAPAPRVIPAPHAYERGPQDFRRYRDEEAIFRERSRDCDMYPRLERSRPSRMEEVMKNKKLYHARAGAANPWAAIARADDSGSSNSG